MKCPKNHKRERNEGRSSKHCLWKNASKADIYWSYIIYKETNVYQSDWSFQQPCAEDIMNPILQVKRKMENRNRKEHAQSCKADLCLMAKSNSQAHSFPMHSALDYVCYASICFSLSYPEMHKNPWYVDCYAVYLHVISKLPLFSRSPSCASKQLLREHW